MSRLPPIMIEGRPCALPLSEPTATVLLLALVGGDETGAPDHIRQEVPTLDDPCHSHDHAVKDSAPQPEQGLPAILLFTQHKIRCRHIEGDRWMPCREGCVPWRRSRLPGLMESHSTAEHFHLPGAWPAPVILED